MLPLTDLLYSYNIVTVCFNDLHVSHIVFSVFIVFYFYFYFSRNHFLALLLKLCYTIKFAPPCHASWEEVNELATFTSLLWATRYIKISGLN